MISAEHLWLSVGFLGQAFFSIGGGLTLFIYAVYRLDPVFILGQGAGLFVYCRNLYLIRRRERRLAEAGT